MTNTSTQAFKKYFTISLIEAGFVCKCNS